MHAGATTPSATRRESRERIEPAGFVRALAGRLMRDDASGMAAELAYRFVLALFPFGLFLAALGAIVAAWAGIGNPTEEIIAGLGDNLPPALADTIRPELEQVIGTQRPGLASIGALLALWSATSGTMTIIKAMNRAYGVEETRPLVARYALGVGLTVAGSIAVIAAFVTIVGGALITEQIAEELGATGQTWQAISLLRWPAVFALLALGAAWLYRVGPNMRPSWRTALAGGLVFSAGWLGATFAFALYVANFASYGATYGALGGVIVLLIWLYLTGLAIVIGAGVVALLTERLEPERLAERREAVGLEVARREAERLKGSVEAGVREATRKLDPD
ncbi:MAG TPA: YihY/virulence factor BrkB family protein [Clostridia bacterium]|nr:YihY/virulence factor BrkB family protein [Clostridia bacterium]